MNLHRYYQSLHVIIKVIPDYQTANNQASLGIAFQQPEDSLASGLQLPSVVSQTRLPMCHCCPRPHVSEGSDSSV
jgi:hypothetical protein